MATATQYPNIDLPSEWQLALLRTVACALPNGIDHVGKT